MTAIHEIRRLFVPRNLIKAVIVFFLLYIGLTSCAGNTVTGKNKHLISIAQIEKIRGDTPDFLFVDIRNKDNFRKIHIKNSLNIDPHFLTSKTFLKGKKIVLVYGGINRAKALELARNAESKGFKSVSVLDGGITAWVEAGLEVQSYPGRKRDLHTVEPGDLYLSARKAPHSFVIVVLGTETSIEKFFPETRICRLEEKQDNAITTLEKLGMTIKDLRKQISLPIIVVDKSGAIGNKIYLFNTSANVKQLFYLEGGLKSYRNYVEKMALIAKGKKNLGQRLDRGCE
ncbi:MAG: hypothetical protein DRG59_12885 [Deltaproteobacteria bacterium]|nr:MAG: hypothetical protein DRG59_12885 [Deltaproteobacteria bacterium]